MHETLFLIGFPGCGKTTLGKELSRLTGGEFIDLDERVEQATGLTVKQLFDQRGEAAFRALERQALESAPLDGAIVACGGGTPCHSGNMEWMNAHGFTVWLTTSPQRLIDRLCLPEHRFKRPSIARLTDDEIAQYVHSTLALRAPFYSQARMQFDATLIETAEETVLTARRLMQALKQTKDTAR